MYIKSFVIPVPIIYIGGIGPFFNDPPWISFTPLGHFSRTKKLQCNVQMY